MSPAQPLDASQAKGRPGLLVGLVDSSAPALKVSSVARQAAPGKQTHHRELRPDRGQCKPLTDTAYSSTGKTITNSGLGFL